MTEDRKETLGWKLARDKKGMTDDEFSRLIADKMSDFDAHKMFVRNNSDFLVSRTGVVYYTVYGGHAQLRSILGLSCIQDEEAGWVHVSGHCPYVRCPLTNHQRRALKAHFVREPEKHWNEKQPKEVFENLEDPRFVRQLTAAPEMKEAA